MAMKTSPAAADARLKTRPTVLAAAIAGALFAGADSSHALPTGGQVAAGQAIISQPSAAKLQIDQASHKAILNWQSFSIGSSEHVNFSQPSASAIALNRVLGNNPSEIFGRLTAWQNWVFQRPNASGEAGALRRYGTGLRPEYDQRRV